MKLQHLLESYKDAKKRFIEQGASKEEATSYVHAFKQIQQRLKGQEKDISHWIRQGWLSFKNFVDTQQQEASRKQQLKVIKKKGAIKLVDTDEISIILPLNPESACKYGANTKWCIASSITADPNSSDYYHELFSHDFMDYTFSEVPVYIVNFKVNPTEKNLEASTVNIQNKMAVAIYERNDIKFFDEKDDDMLIDDGVEILKEYGVDINDLIAVDRKLKPYIEKYKKAYVRNTINRFIDVVDFNKDELDDILHLILNAGPSGEDTAFMAGERLYNLEKKILENPKVNLDELFDDYYDSWLNPKTAASFIKDWVKGGLASKLVYINYLAGDTEYFYRNVGYLVEDIWETYYEGKRWPEAEKVFKLDVQAAIHYARSAIKGRWYEAEPVILEEPDWILEYYYDAILEYESEEGGNPIWIEAIEKYPNILIPRYVTDFVAYGDRNETLEPYIKKLTGVQGFNYMTRYYNNHIIEGNHGPERWPELEEKFRRLREGLPKEALSEVLKYAAHNNFTKWKALWDQINSPKLKISKTARKQLQSKYKRLIGDPPN